MDRLREMIKDEAKAPKDYYKLMKQLPVKDRPKIQKIISQERKHYKILTKLEGKR